MMAAAAAAVWPQRPQVVSTPAPSGTRPTYFKIHLSVINATAIYFTIYLYFINATDLLYDVPIDLPLFHQCNRITLSTRPTYFTIYHNFINAANSL